MSYYVRGSGRSYEDYLQTKSFVDDVRWEISQAGQQVIATRDELKRQGFRIGEALEQSTARVSKQLEEGFGQVARGLEGMSGRLEDIDQTLTRGFITVHQDLMSIESGIDELGAKFHWGIGRLEDAIGGLGDSLQTLVQIAKTPEQTWAFEQFDVARDACKRGLFVEGLEYAQRAINGYQSHTGYKLEHRFHLLVGRILKGDFQNNETVNLPEAEVAYVTAYRYARTTNPEHAGHALTGAAYAAYCQDVDNKVVDAERYLDEAVTLSPRWGETHFLRGKVKMYRGLAEQGLNALERAIRLDPVFAAKADGDGDYRRHHKEVLGRIDRLRREIVAECQSSLGHCVRVVANCQEICLQANNVVSAFVREGSRSASVRVSTSDPNAFARLGSELHRSAQAFNYQTYLGAYEAAKQLNNFRDLVAQAISALSSWMTGAVHRDLGDAVNSVYVREPEYTTESQIETGASSLAFGAFLLVAILFIVSACSRTYGGFGQAFDAFLSTVFGGGFVSFLAGVTTFFVAKFVGKQNNDSKRESWQQDVARRRQSVEDLARTARAAVSQMQAELTSVAGQLPSPTTSREVVAS